MQRFPRPPLALVAALALGLGVAAAMPPLSQAASSAPTITAIRCWPAGACPSRSKVPESGSLLISSDRRIRRPVVLLPGERRMTARPTAAGQVLIRLPSGTPSGTVKLAGDGMAWSAPSTAITVVPNHGIEPPRPTGTAFDGNGMWIWELPHTERGSIRAIVAKARANDITTVFVKSSDSDHMYPRGGQQFTSSLVSALHEAGLQVCAWPFVYGNRPSGEARMTIKAIKLGADCLAIDAEGQYEGKYRAADLYMSSVRRAVGASYPISLAGFPYADWHGSFPYSVFLGPGAARINQPQTYWRDIGESVDRVLSHTWMSNLPYGRPIVPIGQLWQAPSASELKRFRSLAARWGSPGVSWWDWQESKAAQWPLIGSSLGWPPARTSPPSMITVAPRAKGDLVRWAQMHLKAAGWAISPSAVFDRRTESALKAFQRSRNLPVTDRFDDPTWRALLKVRLPLPTWAGTASARPGSTSDRASVGSAASAVHRRGSRVDDRDVALASQGRSEFRQPRPGG